MMQYRRYRHSHLLTVFTDAHAVQVFQTFNAIDEQHAVQMVYLMVDDDGIKALKDPVEAHAPLVHGCNSQKVRPGRLPVQAGKTETTIKILSLISRLDDFRINQRNAWVRLAASIAPCPQPDNHPAVVSVHLGSRQPDALRMSHQCVFEIFDQSLGAAIEFPNRLAFRVQRRLVITI